MPELCITVNLAEVIEKIKDCLADQGFGHFEVSKNVDLLYGSKAIEEGEEISIDTDYQIQFTGELEVMED